MQRLLPISALSDNYIWAVVNDDGRALLVDPGEAEPVFRAAAAQGWIPDAVLLTHHHPDHVGGLPELKRHWPHLYSVAPVDPRISGVDQRVTHGDNVLIDSLGQTFRVIEIPGHTRTHIAFHNNDWLFCGDTLFSLGCGRLFEGTPEDMVTSLDRLAALPPHLAVCCAHEYTAANGRFALTIDPDNVALAARIAEVAKCRAMNQPSVPSRLDSELACNPFLRCSEPAIKAAVAAATGVEASDRIACFAALRQMKDGFRG